MKLLTCFQPFGVLEDPTKELRASKKKIFSEIVINQKKMKYAQEILTRCRFKEIDLKKAHGEADLRLAMMDGRFKVVPPYKPEKSPKEKRETVKKLFKFIEKLSEADKLAIMKQLKKGM